MTNEAIIELDRFVRLDRLSRAVAQVLGLPCEKVASHNTMSPHGDWYTGEFDAGVQITPFGGDFPVEVVVFARKDFDPEALSRALAPLLGAAVLTDTFGVEPHSDIQWMMITPDGQVSLVTIDDDAYGAEDHPVINLSPESRRLYDARMAQVVAAD